LRGGRLRVRRDALQLPGNRGSRSGRRGWGRCHLTSGARRRRRLGGTGRRAGAQGVEGASLLQRQGGQRDRRDVAAGREIDTVFQVAPLPASGAGRGKWQCVGPPAAASTRSEGRQECKHADAAGKEHPGERAPASSAARERESVTRTHDDDLFLAYWICPCGRSVALQVRVVSPRTSTGIPSVRPNRGRRRYGSSGVARH
jgi:hypothetical protein